MTSGAFSPCLKKNVAMGYVEKPYAKSGTELKVQLCRLPIYGCTVTYYSMLHPEYVMVDTGSCLKACEIYSIPELV